MRYVRLALAFFLAPLVVAVPLWLLIDEDSLLVATLYGWTGLVGIPGLALLRRCSWLRWWQVTLAVALWTLAFGAVFILTQSSDLASEPKEFGYWAPPAALLLVLGGLAGLSFWLIALWRTDLASARPPAMPRWARVPIHAAFWMAVLCAWLFIGIERRWGEWGEVGDAYFIKRHPTLQLVFANPVKCGECDVPQTFDVSMPEFASYCRVRFDLSPGLCFQRMRDWQSFANTLASDRFAPFLDRCWPRLDLAPARCYERFVAPDLSFAR